MGSNYCKYCKKIIEHHNFKNHQKNCNKYNSAFNNVNKEEFSPFGTFKSYKSIQDWNEENNNLSNNDAVMTFGGKRPKDDPIYSPKGYNDNFNKQTLSNFELFNSTKKMLEHSFEKEKDNERGSHLTKTFESSFVRERDKDKDNSINREYSSIKNFNSDK